MGRLESEEFEEIIMKSLQYILYTCLLSLLFSMAVFAADGQLSFSDPTGKVGEEITVNMKDEE